MEPNTTTCPSAAGTYPAILEQGVSSANAKTDLSPPPFLPQPSPGLMSEWASGSVLPAMEQEHATSSLPLLSPSFPELGEVHMAGGGGGDFFAQQEAPAAATDIPAVLGGQQQPPQGLAKPSSGEWSVPAFPNAAFAGFTDQPALLEPNAALAWQNEMPPLSLPSGSGLPAPSIGGGGGGGGPAILSSEYDLAPLPESLHIPWTDEASMCNMPSTIDASMYNMPSTIDGSLMHWPCGSSSMGVGSSMSTLQDLTLLPMMSPQLFQGVGSFMSHPQDMTMEAPMLQVTPPLSQGVGRSMSSQQDMTIGALGAPVLPMTPSLPQGVASFMTSKQDLTIGDISASMLRMAPSLPQGVGNSMSSPQNMTSPMETGAMGPPALPMTASISQDVGNFMTSQQDLTTIANMSTSMLPMTPSLPQGVGNSMSSPQDLTIGAMEAHVLPMTSPMTTGAMGPPAMSMTASMSQGVGSFMTSQQDLTTIGHMSTSMLSMTSLPQDFGNSMSSPQDLTIGAMEAPVLPMTSPMATGAMGPPALPMTASMSQDAGSFMTSQQDLATIGNMSTSMLPMTPSLPQGFGNSMSSLQDITIEAMEAPMLPMTTPLSQEAQGQIAQPTSDTELTQGSASLQASLLQVKEEPVDVTTTHREPVFVSLIDDEEDELDHDAIPHSMPDSSTTGGVESLSTKLKMLEQLYNIRNMSRGAKKSSMMPPMPLASSTRACASSTLLSSSTWAGGRRKLPSSTREGDSSTLPSSTREDDSSSHIDVNGVLFTDAEMEILMKDKNMQELATTDAKKVKRTIANRIYSARRNARKEKHTHELEHQAETLQTKWKEMTIKLQLQQVQCAELKANNREMSMMIQELKQQNMLKDGMAEALLAEVVRLRRSL